MASTGTTTPLAKLHHIGNLNGVHREAIYQSLCWLFGRVRVDDIEHVSESYGSDYNCAIKAVISTITALDG